MARILVAGGLHPKEDDPKKHEALKSFSKALGRELIARGHVVLGGCRTSLDAVVATAAEEMVVEVDLDPRNHIRSWVTSTTTPSHDKGEITRD